MEYGPSYWNAAHLSHLSVSAAARCRSYYRLPPVPVVEPVVPAFGASGPERVRFSLYEFQGWEGVDASGKLRLVLGPTELPRAWEHTSTSAELYQSISTLFREPGGPCRFQLRYRPTDLSSLANVCKGDGSCAYQTLYLQSLRAGREQGDRDRFAHGPRAPHLDYTRPSDRLTLISFLEDTLSRIPDLVTHVAVRVRACIHFLRTYTEGCALAFRHWLTVTEVQMLTNPTQVSSLFEMHPGQEEYTLVSHSATRNLEEVFPLSGIYQAATNHTWSGLRDGHFQPLESSLSMVTALEEAITDLVHRLATYLGSRAPTLLTDPSPVRLHLMAPPRSERAPSKPSAVVSRALLQAHIDTLPLQPLPSTVSLELALDEAVADLAGKVGTYLETRELSLPADPSPTRCRLPVPTRTITLPHQVTVDVLAHPLMSRTEASAPRVSTTTSPGSDVSTALSHDPALDHSNAGSLVLPDVGPRCSSTLDTFVTRTPRAQSARERSKSCPLGGPRSEPPKAVHRGVQSALTSREPTEGDPLPKALARTWIDLQSVGQRALTTPRDAQMAVTLFQEYGVLPIPVGGGEDINDSGGCCICTAQLTCTNGRGITGPAINVHDNLVGHFPGGQGGPWNDY